MNAPFSFWFPTVWTLLGATFTIFSFALSYFVEFVRHDIVAQRVGEIRNLLGPTLDTLPRREQLEALEGDVGALKMALTPHGELIAETLRDGHIELLNELQALVAATREIHLAVTGSMTDSQAPETPALSEILTELRRLTKGEPKIQRGLTPFSFATFRKAQAEDLAAGRIQAPSSPFHELD